MSERDVNERSINESSTRLRALGAMVWKEWRERFLWTFAVMLVSALLIGVMFYGNVSDDSRRDRDFLGMWEFTQSVVASAAMLLAFCLGWAQMTGEGKRDAWAFLVHRPVTRRFLFWCKAAAGLSLCALALFVVFGGFAVAMRFVKTPMPWNWRVFSFCFVIWMCCATTYFTGALLALRVRPLIGSRLLPLFGALFFASVLASWQEIQTMMWAMMAALSLIVAVLALASQGCFEGEGFQRRSRATQVALFGVLASGLALLFFCVMTSVSAFEGSLQQRKTPFNSSDTSSYLVANDGRILRFEMQKSAISLRDLNGHVVARGRRYPEKSRQLQLQGFIPLNSTEFLAPPFLGSYGDNFQRLGVSYFEDKRQLRWWFDRAQRRIVGYDYEMGNVWGYIGSNGFSQSAEGATPFEEQPRFVRNENDGDINSNCLLVFSHAIYRCNVGGGSVELLLRSREKIESLADNVFLHKGDAVRFTAPVVITKNTLTILKNPISSTRTATVIAIPDLPDRMIAAAQFPDGRFWLTFQSANHFSAPMTVFALSPEGQILKTERLPSLSTLRENSLPLTTRFATAFLPAAISRWNVAEVQKSLLLNGSTVGANEVRQGLLLSFLLSSLSAFLAWMSATRYAFKSSTRIAWTIAIFLLGPLGLLLMRSLFDWPALEKCPACGKRRVVTREECEHCGQTFGAPASDGTEIVENAAPEVSALRLAS